MKASGIINGNWKGGYMREYLSDAQAPKLAKRERTPLEEIEAIKAKIQNERKFIAKYRCAYKSLAQEAYGRIKYYRLEIAEWRAAIIAAEQEGWNKVYPGLHRLVKAVKK